MDRIRSKTEDSQKTVSVALKAVELKAKSCGFLKENVELSGNTTVQMGEIKVDNKTLNFNIGGKAGAESSKQVSPLIEKGNNKGIVNEFSNTRNVKPSAQNVSDDNGVQ